MPSDVAVFAAVLGKSPTVPQLPSICALPVRHSGLRGRLSLSVMAAIELPLPECHGIVPMA